MSILHVRWSRNLLKFHSTTSKTTKLGRNAYENEMIAHLYMVWPNCAIVGKATAPKVAMMKDHLNRPRHFWLHDILRNEKRANTKLLDVKFDRKNKTKQKIIYLFFRLKIYMINIALWNKLKLKTKEAVLQIWNCIYSHKLHSISVNDFIRKYKLY